MWIKVGKEIKTTLPRYVGRQNERERKKERKRERERERERMVSKAVRKYFYLDSSHLFKHVTVEHIFLLSTITTITLVYNIKCGK